MPMLMPKALPYILMPIPLQISHINLPFTLADKTVNRYTDLKAFMANFVYSSGGSGLLSTMGLNSSKGQAIVYEILTKLGLYGATYLVWKRFGSGIPEAVWKKVMG